MVWGGRDFKDLLVPISMSWQGNWAAQWLSFIQQPPRQISLSSEFSKEKNKGKVKYLWVSTETYLYSEGEDDTASQPMGNTAKLLGLKA